MYVVKNKEKTSWLYSSLPHKISREPITINVSQPSETEFNRCKCRDSSLIHWGLSLTLDVLKTRVDSILNICQFTW